MRAATSRSRTPLSRSTKLAYGSGSIAFGVATQGLSGAVLQIYLNQVLGLPALLVGTTIMASLIVDAVLDPMIGQWSDTFRSRWGRRHPFMYASSLPAALFFFLLWNAPWELSGAALVAFSLAILVALRISLSLYEIPSNALTPELTSSYDERTSLQSYRWFFSIVGGAAVALVLNEVFLRTSAHNRLGILNRAGYAHWGALAAAAIFLSILISTLGTHDRIRHLPQRRGEGKSLRTATREIRLTLSNRSLVALLLGATLGGVGAAVRAGLSIYLYTHFWGLEPAQFGLLVPLGAVGSVLAVVIAPPLSRRFGKKPVMIALFLVSVVTSAGPLFLRLVGLMPPNGSPWIMPILIADGMLTGTVAVVGFILVGSMMADVVEDAEVKTGVRSEGLLYATNGLLHKFTGGIGAFLTGAMLAALHFPAHAMKGTVSPELMRHLVMIYLPLTSAISILSIAVLGLYRIDRTVHESNLRTLGDAAAAEALEGGDEAPLISTT